VNNWKVIFATAVIFGAGVVTGGLLVNHVQHGQPGNPPRRAEGRPQNGGPNQFRQMDSLRPRQPELNKEFVEQLDGALQLTPEQRMAIQKIVADGQDQNHSIWTNNAAQMRKVMQDVQRQIREQLTPEQQKEFPDLLRQFRGTRRPGNTNAPVVLPPTNAPATARTNGP
jgi:hypothetical protein